MNVCSLNKTANYTGIVDVDNVSLFKAGLGKFWVTKYYFIADQNRQLISIQNKFRFVVFAH